MQKKFVLFSIRSISFSNVCQKIDHNTETVNCNSGLIFNIRCTSLISNLNVYLNISPRDLHDAREFHRIIPEDSSIKLCRLYIDYFSRFISFTFHFAVLNSF